MNPALITTFARNADATLQGLGGPLTRTRVGAPDLTLRGILRTELAPVGEFGERMEQRHTLTVAASADLKIGDTVFTAVPAATWLVAQAQSNNGFIAVYALRTPG